MPQSIITATIVMRFDALEDDDDLDMICESMHREFDAVMEENVWPGTVELSWVTPFGSVPLAQNSGAAEREAVLMRENKRLRAAVEMSIRSHEALVELNILPPQYRQEGRKITEKLWAALHADRMARQGDGGEGRE